MEYTIPAIIVGALLAIVCALFYLQKSEVSMCPDPLQFVVFIFGLGVFLSLGFFGGVWLVTQISHLIFR